MNENSKLKFLNEFILSNKMIVSDHTNFNDDTIDWEIPNESKFQKESQIIDAIKKDAGNNVLIFINQYLASRYQSTILFTSNKRSVFDELDFNNIRAIINLQVVNKHKQINDFFRSINTLLPDAGLYIGCFEPYYIRKRKIEKRFGKIPTKMLWTFDFVFNRVIPRLKVAEKMHYFVTRKNYQVIDISEALGRLIFCGFEIVEYTEIDDKIYFVVIKTGEPKVNDKVSNGPFFQMKRVGKNGKLIEVYKLRTMHPYSEYLQKYMIQRNGYNEFGKVNRDYRVTVWSKIIRKLYLDEIPQLINVLKGDMNLVGVRPLSQVSYNLLPEDLKIERIKYKPGCIPPYIALGTKGLDGVLEAERIYLNEMKNGPLKTNFKYFFKSVFNLLLLKPTSN
jgi:lipopolysaccharide/colanic/teichoic acid biosynthesis glycosyltransferase